MYDSSLLLEKLGQIDDALAKIERRFIGINSYILFPDFWPKQPFKESG